MGETEDGERAEHAVKFRSAVVLGLESWFVRDPAELVTRAKDGGEPNVPVLSAILEREGLATGVRGPRIPDLATAEAQLLLYAPNDFVAGTHGLYRNRREPPAKWSDSVLRSSLRAQVTSQYLTWISLVEFKPEHIGGVISEIRTGGLDIFDPLFQAILPGGLGEQVALPYRAKRRAVCVLCLEPDAPVPFDPNYDRSQEVGTAVKALRTSIDFAEIAAVNHANADLLYLRSRKWAPPEVDLAVLRFGPMPTAADEAVMRLPASAADVALALAAFPIYRHVNGRLRSHSFLSTRADAYARKMNEHGHIYNAYEKIFVRERANASLLALESDACLQELADRTTANRLLLLLHEGQSKGVEFDDAGQVFVKSHNNLLAELERELAAVRASAEQAVRSLRDRERVYSDFFRDMVIAESTRENIKLQSVLRLLTIVAIVIATLALFIGMMSEDMRASLLESLLSPFRQSGP